MVPIAIEYPVMAPTNANMCAKIQYTQNRPLHVSVNYVTVVRNIKQKVRQKVR